MGKRVLGCMLVVLFAGSAVNAAMIVEFDQDVYTVTPGADTVITANIMFDADDSTAGWQPMPGGLFSMGVKVIYSATDAQVGSVADITIPAEINGDGVGGPAFKEVGSGYAGGAGSRDLADATGYDGTLLVTILIKDISPLPFQPYSLTLAPYFATKANFVGFAEGDTLDSMITFGSARVVPEPVSMSLLGLGGLALLGRKK
jgi:hypothetical protein